MKTMLGFRGASAAAVGNAAIKMSRDKSRASRFMRELDAKIVRSPRELWVQSNARSGVEWPVRRTEVVMMDDYYLLLGISRDAGMTQIKRAYRRLSMRFHPDVAGDDGVEQYERI